MDADWNEWLAELSRRIQAGTLDIMGRAAYPATTPYAFQITASSPGGKNVLTIGRGRMYVDGLLAENHGSASVAEWDPALGEMSGSPQPPPASETGAINYSEQPYLPTDTTPAPTPPVFEPGLPALRVEHNVVRVPLGEALEVFGYGAFSIENNHLGCGGTIRAAGRPLAETVLIMNLGTALEVARTGTFSGKNQGNYYYASAGARALAGSPGGAVIFTNNICQLETRVSGRHCLCSVLIFTLDDLIFSNNQCRLDGPEATARLDAWLLAGSLQVTGNRFQEALGFPVLMSGLTVGALRVRLMLPGVFLRV